jgi:hypothetical protein
MIVDNILFARVEADIAKTQYAFQWALHIHVTCSAHDFKIYTFYRKAIAFKASEIIREKVLLIRE